MLDVRKATAGAHILNMFKLFDARNREAISSDIGQREGRGTTTAAAKAKAQAKANAEATANATTKAE